MAGHSKDHSRELSPIDPVWSDIGRHWRFRPSFLAIAEELLSATLTRPTSLTGRYLAIHIRQGDFIGRWDNDVFTLDPYIEAVKDMQGPYDFANIQSVNFCAATLSSNTWLALDLPVIVATDSVDAGVLEHIAQLGWHYINHTAFETASKYSDLYPAMLDSAILAHARGFVGQVFGHYPSRQTN